MITKFRDQYFYIQKELHQLFLVHTYEKEKEQVNAAWLHFICFYLQKRCFVFISTFNYNIISV